MKTFVFIFSTLFLSFDFISSEGLEASDIVCPEVCKACDSPTVCTSCIDNYFLNSGEDIKTLTLNLSFKGGMKKFKKESGFGY